MDYFNAKKIINCGKKFIGYPYKWGGSCPSESFDCSGFVCYIINASGIAKIKRVDADTFFKKYCQPIKKDQITAGDFIFFTRTYPTKKNITHIGIYLSKNLMLHCGEKHGVEIIDLKKSILYDHIYAYGKLRSF